LTFLNNFTGAGALGKLLRSPRLVPDALWSFSANAVSVTSGLAVVKIISKLVPSVEYGRASLVLGVLALLNGFLAGPALAVHLRLHFDYQRFGAAAWFARFSRRVLFGVSVGVTLLYLAVALAYAARGARLYLALLVPAAMIIFLQPQVSATTNYLEAHRRYAALAMANVLPKIFQIPGLLFLLLLAIPGANAIVLSQALAILPLLFVFRVQSESRSLVKSTMHKHQLNKVKRSALEFGGSVQIGYAVMWVLTTSDRYVIEHFRSLQDVGVYAMNYAFWSMPYLLLNGWLETLTRSRLYERAAQGDWAGAKRVLFWRGTVGVTLALLGTLIILLIGRPLAVRLIGNYWNGWKLMMLISTGHIFLVLGYSIIPFFLAAKRARSILVATLAAAAANVTLNWFAVPALGILGAGLNTLVAYAVWAACLGSGAYLVSKTLTENPVILNNVETIASSG
jgi:O-antigen/teichoic acid export membrane protein